MIRITIEEIDPETNCVVQSASLDIFSTSEIENCINIDFGKDELVDRIYYLSKEDLALLVKKFQLSGFFSNVNGRIRKRVRFDDLPYKVHTGSELLLMLKGEKPMAFFSYRVSDCSGIKEEIDADFLSYVDDGKIVKFEQKIDQRRRDGTSFEIDYIIYTLPNETWRANALITLKESGARSGWSEGMERMEGILLGYSDLQNDIFIEKIFRRPT